MKKENAIVYHIQLPKVVTQDIRDVKAATWRDVLVAIMQYHGKPMTLSDLYESVSGHQKCQTNHNYKAKIRQTLYHYPNFISDTNGNWSLVRKEAL